MAGRHPLSRRNLRRDALLTLAKRYLQVCISIIQHEVTASPTHAWLAVSWATHRA